MRQFSKIFSDVTKTVGSSGVQFLITMFTTPIMTRLYDPSAYAIFGIINTAATTLIGVGLLSLPNAYPIENDSSRRMELIRLMLLLLSVLVVLATIIAASVAATDTLYAGEHFSNRVLILLPLLVLTFGLRQIMVSVATERANFSRLAFGQMLEPICSRGGSIVLGAVLGGRPSYILASVVVGNIVAALTILKMSPHKIYHRWRSLLKPAWQPMKILRRYSDFVIYSTSSQQAQTLVMLGIQMSIAAFFSSHEAGHYILAFSVLTLPSTLIALATAPVVYRHFIDIERTQPAQLLRHLTTTIILYLLAGSCILAPIYFFGEEIFKFVFGDVWTQSGMIASYLSFAYIIGFPVIGVQAIFRVIGHLKLQFILEISTCTLALLAAIACFRLLDFDNSMVYLAVIWFLRNIIVLGVCVAVTFQHAINCKRVS